MNTLDFERDGNIWPTARWTRFVRAAGRRFAVLQEGAGPELLLIHGVGGSMHGWSELLPLLTPHFRVTALDLPGHGFSELPPDDRLTLDGISEDLAELLSVLGSSPELFLGHSAGAGIGVKLVLDGHVSPRVLVGVNPSLVPPSRMPMPPIVERLARPFVRSESFAAFWARFGKVEWVIRKMIDSTGSRIPEAHFRCYRAIARHSGHVHAALTMMTQWRPEILASGFSTLTDQVPVVGWMAGSRDEWIPMGEVRDVASRIPGSKLVAVEAGHLAPEETPGPVASLLREAWEMANPKT